MTKDNEQYAYLTITGDFDPKVITERLDLQPSECWKKGDRNERTQREKKFSRWSLKSRLDHSASLEDHVEDVLNQIHDHASVIHELSLEFDCGVQLVGYFHNDYPGFGLSNKLIAGLARLNLGIDCDFYYLYSHEREDSE